MNFEEADRRVKRINRKKFEEIADNIEEIAQFIKEGQLQEKFECYQLDNFERLTKKQNYIIWGAGKLGKKIFKTLTLLNKKVDFWCAKSIEDTGIDGMKIVSTTEALNGYQNQIIIIASRKYRGEIIDSIMAYNADLKSAIFEFDAYQYGRLYNEEYKKKSIVSYPPLWMTIGITSACANKCLFCAYHGEDAKKLSNVYGMSYMLSYKDFTRIVDMAKKGGVPQIHVCGTGEPFINPQVIEMIDYAISKYGEISLQTDFWKELYDRKGYLDKLIEREKYITYIATDVLSSVPEEHERIKQGASYDEFLEMMEYIGKNSSLVIRINVVLTKQNYKNLKGIVDQMLLRNVNFEIHIVNLLSYDYSEFTSSDNVYTSNDVEITQALTELEDYCKEKDVKVVIPKPADSDDAECYVFWAEFQTWPVKGNKEEHYVDNMIPHACAAVVRGELNSVGYLFEYDNIMDAWNNEKLVKIRENLMQDKYPSSWCSICPSYQKADSYYKMKTGKQI